MSAPPTDDRTTAPRQLVVFALGTEEYALPIGDVHEIIRYTTPRTVASTDPSVQGVISLRGRILPVYDLAVRLGLAATGAAGKIVIVQTGTSAAGVVVDDVTEVLTLAGDQLDLEGGLGVRGDGVEGVAKVGDRLVVLLTPSVLDGEEGVDAPAATPAQDAPVASAPSSAAPSAGATAGTAVAA